MKKITARIETTDDGMWLLIDGAEAGDDTAWAIKKEEIKPIMIACADWELRGIDK